jgi:hypothetical protein
MLDGMQDLKDMMQGLNKQNQTHVTFDNDKVMLKKDELDISIEKNHKMYLTLKNGTEIILENTNFNQFKTAWNK